MSNMCHPPLPDPPAQPGIPPTSQVGDVEETVLEVRPLSISFSFLGAAWAKPARKVGEEVSAGGGRPTSSSSGQSSSDLSAHSPFPPRLGGQPHAGKVEPLNGALEKEDGGGAEGRGQAGAERSREPPPESSGAFPYSIRREDLEGSKANHLQLLPPVLRSHSSALTLFWYPTPFLSPRGPLP